MSELKALIIRMPPQKDLGNVIQVARAEGTKIFHKPDKIKVVDLIQREYGWIAVVQNGSGSRSEHLTP